MAIQDGFKGANTASAISSALSAATGVFEVISRIDDQKKRQLFQQNFSAISLDQQIKLDKSIRDAQSETEKFRILADALTKINIQRISGKAETVIQQERAQRNQKIILASVLLTIGLVGIFLIAKQN